MGFGGGGMELRELDKHRLKAFQLISEERDRQISLDKKWTTEDYKLVVLGEEYGELCWAVQENFNELEEATHVAAVATHIIEDILKEYEPPTERV